MPIYEYRCGACSHHVEALQKISDSPLRKCPECGKLFLRRLMSAPSFRLKGGGWYETDFKGGGDEKKRNLVEISGGESSESSVSATVDSGKTNGDTPAKSSDAAAKDSATKPTAEKPAASTVKKSTRKTTRTSKRT
jgi:putative FmdB family regulatory protein